MYHILSIVLFWCYWLIALATGVLLVRELLRGKDWRVQVTAALALIPFVLRVLLIK
ncbi:MAG TPA: hypothetical protein VGL38_05080 [bacterium]|jgi:hypothetical protein